MLIEPTTVRRSRRETPTNHNQPMAVDPLGHPKGAGAGLWVARLVFLLKRKHSHIDRVDKVALDVETVDLERLADHRKINRRWHQATRDLVNGKQGVVVPLARVAVHSRHLLVPPPELTTSLAAAGGIACQTVVVTDRQFRAKSNVTGWVLQAVGFKETKQDESLFCTNNENGKQPRLVERGAGEAKF